MHSGRDSLIVFTRYPALGLTKTRLIPALGPLGAAQLHRQLAVRTLQKARDLGSRHGLEIEVRYFGATRRQMRRWLGPGLTYREQCEGDIGRRMDHAMSEAMGDGCGRVLLIGTDVPGCTVEALQRALAAIEAYDLVLGPTTDGGYWLIGLRRPARLFNGVAWGTDAVLRQTLERAADQGLRVLTLAPLSDVDRPEDLAALEPDLRPTAPLVSVIIPALNEAENLSAAIRSARAEGAEIIVVDGGSSDDTVARAEACGAAVVRSLRGRAVQMNAGAHVARGEVLLFLHADTRLPAGFADMVFEALLDRRACGGAFRLRMDAGGWRLGLIAWLANLRTKITGLPYGDQAIFVRRADFHAVGGFPETALAEDLFFCRTLARTGRLRILDARVVTSARRFQAVGPLRALAVNAAITVGCRLGISPARLARWYTVPQRG
jgi:uncharacterized protein